jgi:uncharacterized tellurite resistance protein B-like protein
VLRKLLDRVTAAFDALPDGNDAAARDNAIRLATAVLMAEVARADRDFSEAEFDSIVRLAAERFDLDIEDAAELANRADETAAELVSLHEFTQLLHSRLDAGEKAAVVRCLWDVAYADGRLDMYEDALVLKISDLLYVSRGTVMRLKHDARTAQEG